LGGSDEAEGGGAEALAAHLKVVARGNQHSRRRTAGQNQGPSRQVPPSPPKHVGQRGDAYRRVTQDLRRRRGGHNVAIPDEFQHKVWQVDPGRRCRRAHHEVLSAITLFMSNLKFK
jgi:hypothetical protein